MTLVCVVSALVFLVCVKFNVVLFDSCVAAAGKMTTPFGYGANKRNSIKLDRFLKRMGIPTGHASSQSIVNEVIQNYI